MHKPSKGAGAGTTLIKAMHAHLNCPIALDWIDAQTAGNQRPRNSAAPRTRCCQAARVVAHLFPGREAGLIVIELDIVSEDGICLGRITGRKGCIEQKAVHPSQCIEEGTGRQSIGAISYRLRANRGWARDGTNDEHKAQEFLTN